MTFGALGGFLRTPKNPPGYGPACLRLLFVCLNMLTVKFKISNMDFSSFPSSEVIQNIIKLNFVVQVSKQGVCQPAGNI